MLILVHFGSFWASEMFFCNQNTFSNQCFQSNPAGLAKNNLIAKTFLIEMFLSERKIFRLENALFLDTLYRRLAPQLSNPATPRGLWISAESSKGINSQWARRVVLRLGIIKIQNSDPALGLI